MMASGALRVLTAVGLIVSTGAAGAEPAHSPLTMIELQPLSSQSNTHPFAMNDSGVSVGVSNNRPARWDRDGNVTDLGTLGGEWGAAVDVNDAGVAVGHAQTESQALRATAWTSDGDVIDLGAPDHAMAVAINDRGTIVGIGGPDGAGLMWDRDGRLTLLHGVGVDESVRVVDVADDGAVVGVAIGHEDQVPYALRWDGRGRVVAVGPPGSVVDDVAEGGWAVGHTADQTDRQQSFTWRRSGRTTELAILPGGRVNFAAAVNRHGITVGGSDTAGDNRSRAARWDRRGEITELAGSADYLHTHAVDVNDSGTATGYGSDTRDGRIVENAMRWDRLGRVTYLGTLPGTLGSTPVDINDRGMVIGWSRGAFAYSRGVLWR